MRPTAAVALLALLAVAGRADPPTLGTVTADVVLRAAPKADAADTGKLARGQTVIVRHAEGDDWLAVEPPNGAVSWISHLHLDGVEPARPFPQIGTVTADGEVRLAAGKAGVNGPLDVRRTRIPDGTLVTVLGPKVKQEDGSGWYPIAAPAGDFRYLLRSAVQLGGPVGPGFVVKSPAAPGKPEWSAPTAEKKPAGGSAVVWPNPNHPLWAEAERAEAAGQFDKAEELYFKLAREMNGPGGNAELANLCYSRIHALRERRRAAGGGPATGPVWAASDRTQPASSSDLPPRKPVGGTARAEWTGAGTLRPAGRSRDRQVYYALEDDRGRVLVYAVSGPGGVDLSRYAGKTVDLFGPVTFPVGFEKTGLVTVERVDSSR